jgi:hypothetical protein
VTFFVAFEVETGGIDINYSKLLLVVVLTMLPNRALGPHYRTNANGFSDSSPSQNYRSISFSVRPLAAANELILLLQIILTKSRKHNRKCDIYGSALNPKPRKLMKRTLMIALSVAGAILFSLQATKAQTAIYREVFGNNTTSNIDLSAVGWVGAWGGNAASSLSAPANNFGVSTAIGNPQNLDNINAGGPASSMVNGLVFTSGAFASTTNWLAYTIGYTVDQTLTPIQDISFYAGSAANGAFGVPGFRIAVEIDGNWYASTAVLGNTVGVSSAANFNSQSVQVVFNWTTDASAWDSLTFVPGTSLALGSALLSSLPGDPITAFGLYSDAEAGGGNATRRFDTYQINTVPEPGSVLLVLFGVGMLMGFRRSREA